MTETPALAPQAAAAYAPFDRRAVRLHRDRAAASLGAHDFLFREVAERLVDRLADVTRRFPRALDLGCHGGEVAGVLGARGGIQALVQCDLSLSMCRNARRNGNPTACADEEALPFGAAAFDLVLSNLSLHWANDLPGALAQIRYCLKPDGLFLGALLAGETLHELRGSLLDAELTVAGGVSPRVSPVADMRDLAGLLQRAGFALPVVDSDTITVTYADPFRLMQDLRGMGEANAVAARPRGSTRRQVLAEAASRYRERHGDADGRVPATFQIVYLTAWAPHESQQKPLRPGSAKARLADALGTEERPAGEKTAPE
jgi:SAM-dependent methyltransferase